MKEYANNYLKEILYSFRLNILILFIFFIFTIICFILLRSTILQNSEDLGREISRSYSIEESKNIDSYKDFINRVAIMIEKSETADSSDKWLGEMLKAGPRRPRTPGRRRKSYCCAVTTRATPCGSPISKTSHKD